MTTLAGSPEPVSTTRAPYAPVVMLVGALLVIGFMVRALNAGEGAHPLSGTPVGEGEAPVIVTQADRAPSASIGMQMPLNEAGERLLVGPAAFPPRGAIVLSAVLPTTAPTTIDVTLARLSDDGTLQRAAPVALEVTPDAGGVVRVSTSVDELTAELGAGIYQVRLLWDGRQIGGTDVALGRFQPSNVALFEEARHVSFAPGEYVGVKMDAQGAVIDERPYTLGAASGAPAAAYAYFSGTPHVFISQGVWASYWVPLTEGVQLH